MSALLTARPDKQEEFRQTLRSLQAEIRRQPGCLECTFGQEVSGEPRFLLFMVWGSAAHLEAHLDSEPFRVLLGATSILSAPAAFRYVAADSASSQPGLLRRTGKPKST